METYRNLAQLPPEVLTHIVKFAGDHQTLGSLRLASKHLSYLATPAYAKIWIGTIFVNMTGVDLRRLQKLCSCVSMAQYIKQIYFETINPSESRIRELHKHGYSLDRLGKGIAAACEAMHRHMREYKDLVESGTMTASLQSAFESLRMNGNRSVEIVIRDEVSYLREGFSRELEAIYDENVDDPDNLLGIYYADNEAPIVQDFYNFSEFIPARILLALSRSGLGILGLDIRASNSLVNYPWLSTLRALKQRDNIQPEFVCDQLIRSPIPSSLQRIHIRMFTPFDEAAEIFTFKDNSGLFQILKQAKELEFLQISSSVLSLDASEVGPSFAATIEDRHRGFNRLIQAIPKRKLRGIRLEHLVIDATDLVQLLRGVTLTLQILELEELTIIGDRKALKNFRLSQLPELKSSFTYQLDYYASESSESYELWDPKTGELIS